MNSERISPFWVNGYQPFSAPSKDLKALFQGLAFTPVASRKAQAAALRAEKGGKNVVGILDTPAEEDPDGKQTEDSGEDSRE